MKKILEYGLLIAGMAAYFGFVYPDLILPEDAYLLVEEEGAEYQIPYEEAKQLEMEEIYHPLLHGAVTNSMELQHNCIITGSNASGKSTFIKTIAVNVILAQSIHTCTAKRMHLPHAKMNKKD